MNDMYRESHRAELLGKTRLTPFNMLHASEYASVPRILRRPLLNDALAPPSGLDNSPAPAPPHRLPNRHDQTPPRTRSLRI